MKNVSKRALLLVMLTSISLQAEMLNMPSMETMKNTMVLCMIGAAAMQLNLQKSKTQDELNCCRSVQSESMLETGIRIWTKNIVGQIGKEDKLVRFDEDGTAVYEKVPACGMIGRTVTWMQKRGMPICGAVIALQTARDKIMKGLNSYGIGSWGERVLSMLPEIPSCE